MKVISDVRPIPEMVEEFQAASELAPLLARSATLDSVAGVVTGELVGMTEEGTPLVVFRGQAGSAAVPARSVVDLRGAHVGKQVVLLFEESDRRKPIVMGVLRSAATAVACAGPEHVHVETDGGHVTVTAKDRLVLRCGKASITLTKEGKLLLHGAYISSHASGANRIKGGSVEIN